LSVGGFAVSEPASVNRFTVSPPVVRSLPLASLSWTVMVDVLDPLATIDVGLAVMVEVSREAGPGKNVTVAPSIIGGPLRVPVMVAVPAVVDEVSVAVYVPSVLSFTGDSTPRLVAKTTVSPPVVIGPPTLSWRVTVIVDVLDPSATIDVGVAVICDVVGSGVWDAAGAANDRSSVATPVARRRGPSGWVAGGLIIGTILAGFGRLRTQLCSRIAATPFSLALGCFTERTAAFPSVATWTGRRRTTSSSEPAWTA
jgi:hypothetical protein